MYNEKLFKELGGKPKETWKHLNRLTKGSTNEVKCNEIKIGNDTITDNKIIATRFNEYYVTIAQTLEKEIVKCTVNELNLIKPVRPLRSVNNFFLKPVSVEEVHKIMFNLKKSNTVVNGIPGATVFKKCCDYLADHVAYLINLSFEQGIVPAILKVSRVIPIFKIGDKQDLGNYRPISTQSPLAKIYEKCFKSRLVNFLESNNYFYKCQYGFRKNSSTLSATVDVISNI